MADESTTQPSVTQADSPPTIPDESEQLPGDSEAKSAVNKDNDGAHEPVIGTAGVPATITPSSLRDFSKVRRFTIPEAKGSNAASIEHRRYEIALIRKVLTYGPDPVTQVVEGDAKDAAAASNNEGTNAKEVSLSGPLYPSGPLGDLLSQEDTAATGSELAEWEKTVELTTIKALETLMQHSSEKGLIDFEKKRFTSLAGYAALYSDEAGLGTILGSANGGHWPFKGYIENGGSDQLFAFERLTVQPYSLRRLPLDAKLPFAVSDETVRRLTSGQFTSLQRLHDRRRLLYVDFSSLVNLDRFEGRYTGACEAYFWQDPRDKRGLHPLAILVHPLKGKVVPVPPAVHNFEGKGRGLLTTLQLAIAKLVIEVETKVDDVKQAVESEKDVVEANEEGDVAIDKEQDAPNDTPKVKVKGDPADAPSHPLLYTPLDTPAAWTLAKMIFSQNDLFWSAFYHLASTHEVLDIIYLAAARTLNIAHPVFALLSRFTTRTFGVRPILLQKLINKGGPVDQLFPWGGDQAGLLTSQLYQRRNETGASTCGGAGAGAGRIASNYFQTDLSARNLAGAGARSRKYFMGKVGPLKLKFLEDKYPEVGHFPYYRDVKRVHDALWDCIASMIYSSYESDAAVQGDRELCAFVQEAQQDEAGGGAGIQDLPAINGSRVALIDFITHVAYLSSIKHNIINTNGPAYGLNTLPYHPMSFYKPLPTTEEEKAQLNAVDDLVTQGYLPDVVQSLKQVALLHAFARPFYVDDEDEEGDGKGKGRERGQTLLHAFDDADLLRAAPSAFRQAVKVFKERMQVFSDEVRRRNDEPVQSGGEPFKWTVMDPKWCPFFAAI